MTISDETNRVSATGSGSTGQAVPFDFQITDGSDLLVYSRVTATGVEAPLVETTNWTVDILDEGGTLTTVTAVAATSQIHVIRATPATQILDLTQGGSFSAENIEAEFDKVTKLAIENKDGLSRCIRAPETDAATIDLVLPCTIDRASKYLTFDVSGNVQATALGTVGTLAAGTFGTAALATADEAAFKALANLEAGTDFNAYSSHLAALVSILKTDGNFVVGNGTTWVSEGGATVLTSLGISTFMQTVIDDTTALAARTTLGAVGAGDILCWEDLVLSSGGEVLTWAA
jgi:hypothetical protein